MSKNTLKLKIATPDGIAYNDTVFSVNLKTEMGEITILPNHIPLVSALAAGPIRIMAEKENKAFLSGSGVIEVKRGSEVTILADHIG